MKERVCGCFAYDAVCMHHGDIFFVCYDQAKDRDWSSGCDFCISARTLCMYPKFTDRLDQFTTFDLNPREKTFFCCCCSRILHGTKFPMVLSIFYVVMSIFHVVLPGRADLLRDCLRLWLNFVDLSHGFASFC